MNRRKFAKSLIAGVVGLGAARLPAASAKIGPFMAGSIDPAYGRSYYTMTMGFWREDGTIEIVKQETFGTPPSNEEIAKISENFKANLGSCWGDAKEGTVEYFSEPK